MNFKLIKENIFVIAIILFACETFLSYLLPIFSYYDEIITLFFLFGLIVCFVKTGINRDDFINFGILILFQILGLIYNFIYKIQNSNTAIFLDLFSCSKIFIIGFSAKYICYNLDKKYIINVLGKIFIAFAFLLFFLMLLNLFVNYGMRDDIRYGLPSFKFLCENAGQFNYLCYYLVIIIATYSFNRGKGFTFSLLISLIVWASTLRVRTFMFIVLFILLYLYFMKINKGLKNAAKILFFLIIPLFIFASYAQIDKYFLNENSARSVLFSRSLLIFKDYFPFGTGFGTFGTASAAKYYSQLYYDYNLNNVWGLSPDYPAFANDNYWPSILAQFGFFGLLLIATLLYRIFKPIYNNLKNTRNVTIFWLVMFILFLSSLVTASFYHYSTLGIIIFLLIISFAKEKEYE